MKVTTAVDAMATEATVNTDEEEVEVEVGEANKQQQEIPAHLAKIVTLTNGSSHKPLVNGISNKSDLIVTNGDSNHSTPKKTEEIGRASCRERV